MFKRVIAILLASFICVTVFAGCQKPKKTSSSSKSSGTTSATGSNAETGGDGSSIASTTGSGTSSNGASSVKASTNGSSAKAGTSSTSTTGKKKIKIWGAQDNESLLAAVSDYEAAHSDVIFNIETPSENTVAQLNIAITANKQPDILSLDHVYITALGRSKTLLNLNNYGASKIKDKYIENCWKAVSFNNEVYGLPHDGNTIALMYNKDWLDATGYGAPKTYADFVKVGQQMQKNNPGKNAFTAPFFMANDDNRKNWAAFQWFFWLWRCGGEILNDGYTQATFNSAAGVKALDMLKSLVQTDKICYGSGYLEDKFYDGDVGMIEMGNWSIGQLTRTDRAATLSVCELPQLVSNVPNYSGLGLFAMGITAKCQYPDVAFDFLAKYTTNDNYQIEYAKQNNELPVTVSALNNKYYQTANWQVFISQYKKSKYRPGVSCWTQVQTAVADAVTKAIGGADSKACLDAAANTVNALLAKEPK